MNKIDKDYFTFNVHNSALLVGQTGAGKTELARQYMRRLENSFSPVQMKYVIFDFKVVEFDPKFDGGAKREYLYTDVRTGLPKDMDYFEELAALAKKRANEDVQFPLLFVYLDECDFAAQYPARFQKAVLTINRYAKQANFKFIFSTSRPSNDIITEDVRDSFDIILSGRLASETDATYLGIPYGTSLSNYEFAVKEK